MCLHLGAVQIVGGKNPVFFFPPNIPAMSTRCAQHISRFLFANVYLLYIGYIYVVSCQSCQPANMISRRVLEFLISKNSSNFWWLVKKQVFGQKSIPTLDGGVWFVDPPS